MQDHPDAAERAVGAPTEERYPAATLLGRAHHLAALGDALGAARAGRAVTVLVHGPAGMGRSALLRRFLDDAAAGGATVIEGRCPEHPDEPFAALAAPMRALAAHLARIAPGDLDLPEELGALARIFPALPGCAPCLAPDPVEVRRRASLALAGLAGQVAMLATLVLCIDDLQWCDADSAILLRDLVDSPGPPGTLLVAGYRSEDAASVDLAQTLRGRMARCEPVDDVREVMVGPLAPRDALRLARALLPDHAPAEGDADPAEAIARASDGSPRLLRRLTGRDVLEPRAPEKAPTDPENEGDHAVARLAFHRAAALYQRAASAGGSARIHVKLADALCSAGRAEEAARALVAAADHAPLGESVALRCRAAGALLRSGRVAEGIPIARAVLEGVDLALPGTPARARASRIYRRARLALRGLDLEAREDASAGELARADAAGSIARDLSSLDLAASGALGARALALALSSGDAARAASALASEAITAAAEGSDGRARAAGLVARAKALASEPRAPDVDARILAAEAASALQAMRLRDAASLAEAAVRRLRDASDDAAWASSIEASWLLPALVRQGRLDAIAARAPLAMKEAALRGDLVSAARIRAGCAALLRLAEALPFAARREAAEALAASRSGPVLLACVHAVAASYLYEGDGVSSHHHVTSAWSELERARLFTLELPRIEALHLRAAAALAAGAGLPEGARLLREADQDARALEREPSPYADALSTMVRAGLAGARGERGRAAATFARAASAFDALDLGLHASAARRREGELTPGDEGRARIDAADRFLMDQGVRDPERLVATLAPRVG